MICVDNYVERAIYYIVETCYRECNGEAPTLIKLFRSGEWPDAGPLITVGITIDERTTLREFMVMPFEAYQRLIWNKSEYICLALCEKFSDEQLFIPADVTDFESDMEPELVLGIVNLHNIRIIMEGDLNGHHYIDFKEDYWKDFDREVSIVVRTSNLRHRIYYRMHVGSFIKINSDEGQLFKMSMIWFLEEYGRTNLSETSDDKLILKSIIEYYKSMIDDVRLLEMEITENPYSGRLLPF